MDVSIIICTRNNAGRLRATLAAIGECVPPPGRSVELVVVDNGSTDDTATVVRDDRPLSFPTRHLFEPAQGQVRARNRALAETTGHVILFTDDDVVPPPNWVAEMASPILEGRADAVAGAVTLGSEVARPWMTVTHRSYLAATDRLDPSAPGDLVGASMAFARRVLDRVPAFDPELGPGQLGFADDLLFAAQLTESGFHLKMVTVAPVVHNCDPGRLSRRNWLDLSTRAGRSSGYVAYHWQHLRVRFVRSKRVVVRVALAWGRATGRWERSDPEQADPREMDRVRLLAFLDQYARMRGAPRNYACRGLVKERGVLP